MLTRASQGIVFVGSVAGFPKNGNRGTASEKTRRREARLTATRREARVASFDCSWTERNRRVKRRRMWIPRPMDCRGRSRPEAPGKAMQASAAITAAREPKRYIQRVPRIAEAVEGAVPAVAVAMGHSGGCPKTGSVGMASYASRAARYRYGVAAAWPKTYAYARPAIPRSGFERRTQPRPSVMIVTMAAETISG